MLLDILKLMVNLTEMFTMSQNDNYALRSNERKLYLSKPNTNFLKKSFSYRAAVSWNKLPNEILEEHEHLSLNQFVMHVILQLN
jgi:hypothetical protein